MSTVRKFKGCKFNLKFFVPVLACCLAFNAQANPLGGQVVNGAAAINQSGNTLTVTNSPNAIINWQGFSINQNETTNFIQQSAASSVLNRVVGADPSQLLGALISNGKVFLINPSGILVGQGARIDVAGLVASTLNISNTDFLAGKLDFTSPLPPGEGQGVRAGERVINQGSITTPEGGTVYLIAPQIENSGLITTPRGETILAAGNTVQLIDTATPGVSVQVTGSNTTATNLGQILADSGRIGLVGAVVRNSGTLSANSLVSEGGRVFLRASSNIVLDTGSTTTATANPSPLAGEGQGRGGNITLDAAGSVAIGGNVKADGAQGGSIAVNAGGVSLAAEVSARGTTGQGGSIDIQSQASNLDNTHAKLDVSGATGGTIREIAGHQITSSATYLATGTAGNGGNIDLSAPATKLLSAQIDASGATDGGKIRVGGEYQGGKNIATDELPNAQTLAISAGSVIRADGGLPSPLAGEGQGRGGAGNGGTIILWSDLDSALYADVSAQPAGNGQGGFIELSSANKLTWGGTANAGVGGQVLMDPKNIIIQDAAAGGVQYNLTLGYNYSNLPGMTGNNLEANDYFGYAVSLSGTQLAVGAALDSGSGNAAPLSGAVYLFNNPYTTPALSGIIGKGYVGAGNFDVVNLEVNDNFGYAVSLSGTQLAVGAYGDDGFGNAALYSGAVYLFNNPYTTPTLTGIIGKGYASAGNFDVANLEANDYFGIAVSLSGTQLAVGAAADSGFGNAALYSGAVYLFNTPFTAPALTGIIGKGYTGMGNFNVANLEAWDTFGSAVSLSGTQLAVGAYADGGFGNVAVGNGAVYLFNNPYTTPTLTGIIGKGYVGAGNFDVTNQEAYDYFGSAVSLSGTQLAVGAYGDDGFGNAALYSGAVYLFNTPFTAPALTGIIGKGYGGTGDFNVTALEAGDYFGSAVSLSGTQLAVGAAWDSGFGNAAPGSGAVYLFDTPFTTPALSGIIGKGYVGAGNFDVTVVPEAGDQFGSAVSLSGTQLAVGAYQDGGFGNVAAGSGAVYLFNNPYTTPTLTGIIGKGYVGAGNFDVTNLEAYDYFGSAVSLSGTQLAVGANDGGFGNAAPASGAVYLFDTPFTAPTLSGIIGKGYGGTGDFNVTALEAGDVFGISVSLSGTQLAVGAYADGGFGNVSLDSGAVYLFDTPFTTPALSGIIGKGYVGAGNFDVTNMEVGDLFGRAVSLSGTQLAVGAYADGGFGNVAVGSGAVYLFNTPFTAPTLSGIIGKGYGGTGDFNVTALEAGDMFGSAVSLSGAQLAVGANDDGFGNAAPASGAVYLFDNPYTTPALSGIIGKGYVGAGNFDVANLEANDYFGSAVSLSGTQLAVGALGDDGFGNAAPQSGAVYLFTLVPGTNDPATGQTFGFNPGADSTITPASIAAILNTGSALTLQANNDITVTNPITTIAAGAGGTLTMQAGRSILLNANITTDNGNLNLVANDTLAHGVVDAWRDPGAANIVMASGTSINAGTGAVSLQLLDGAGNTNNTAGSITLDGAISAGAAGVTLSSLGAITGAGTVNTAGLLTASSVGGTTLNGANTVGSFSASNSGTGDIWLTNTAATLAIPSVTNWASGGAIAVSNNGNINIAADLSVVSASIFAPMGTVNLTSTGNLTTSQNFPLDIAAVSIKLNANTGIGTSNAPLKVYDNILWSLHFNNTGIGDVFITSDYPIYVDDGNNSGGNITLVSTGIGCCNGSLIQLDRSLGNVTASGNITYVTDNFEVIDSFSMLVPACYGGFCGETVSGTGLTNYVEVKPYTATTAIEFSATPDALGFLRLSSGELDNFSTPLLKIGNSSMSAGIAVTEPVAPAPSAFTSMSLITGGAITQTPASTITIANLNADGAGGVTLTESNAVTGKLAGRTMTGNFAFTNGSAINVGQVDIVNNGIFAPGGSISLTANGAITQTPTSVISAAGTLTTSSAGGTTLNDANTVTGFSAINATGGNIAFNNVGSLSLSGVSNPVGSVTVKTTADMTLNTIVSSGASGNAVVLVAGGAFNTGDNDITLTGSGRWLVYSADPANNWLWPLDGTYAFQQYNAPYGTAVLGSGNGLLYSLVPPLNVSLIGTISKVYDGTTTATLTASNYSGAAVSIPNSITYSNDNLVLSSPGSGQYDTPNVGTGKTVTASGFTLSGLDGNGKYVYYMPASISAAIGDIQPLPIIVTPPTSNAIILSGSKVYDGTPTFTTGQMSISNVVSGDVVSLSAGTADTADQNVGINKPFVSFNGLALTGASAANYTLAGISGFGTITARPVTFTVDHGQGKTYGQFDPTYISFNDNAGALQVVAGDILNGVLTRVAGENAGAYPIGQGSLTSANNPNYDITFVSDVFTINPALLQVVANHQTKVFGAADPESSIVLNGLIQNPDLGIDDVAAAQAGTLMSGTLSREAGEAVGGGSTNGEYAFELGTLSAGGNYTINSFISNTLAITQPLTSILDPLITAPPGIPGILHFGGVDTFPLPPPPPPPLGPAGGNDDGTLDGFGGLGNGTGDNHNENTKPGAC